jgi:hypothetical protein
MRAETACGHRSPWERREILATSRLPCETDLGHCEPASAKCGV